MVVNGSIKIATDRSYFRPGDTITGKAILELTAPIVAPPMEAGSPPKLMIRWKGVEKSIINTNYFVSTTMKNQGTKSRMVVEPASEKREIFNATSALHVFHEGAQPGTFEYPIRFQLPETIPGSAFFTNDETYSDIVKAVIIYRVKCWLEPAGTPVDKASRETQLGLIKRVDRIIVSELPDVSTAIHETNQKSFLLARGKLNMTVDFAKNHYSAGEIIPVKVKVVNDSGKKVDAMKVKLMRTLTVHCEKKKKEFASEVMRTVYPGVEEKSTKDEVLNFKIDHNVCPTTNGNLIECTYHIDVECDVAMALDLEVHPVVVVALTPSHGQPLFLYNKYEPKQWIPKDTI